MTGFTDELIHTFNKHEIFPHHLDYFAKHKNRTNVLLMGDMLGDLRMADGMSEKENLITIGFLNSKVHESFALYRDNFDIVLIDDQTQDIPVSIELGNRYSIKLLGKITPLCFAWPQFRIILNCDMVHHCIPLQYHSRSVLLVLQIAIVESVIKSVSSL